jgi:hypothetical protein
MRIISACLVAILVLNAYCVAGAADPQQDVQPPPAGNAQRAEKVRMKVQQRGTGEKARVNVKLVDKSVVQGYISQIDAASFQVTDNKGNATTIAYDKVEKIGGWGLSKGAKIGIWIGVGAAAAAIVLAVLAAKLNHS